MQQVGSDQQHSDQLQSQWNRTHFARLRSSAVNSIHTQRWLSFTRLVHTSSARTSRERCRVYSGCKTRTFVTHNTSIPSPAIDTYIVFTNWSVELSTKRMFFLPERHQFKPKFNSDNELPFTQIAIIFILLWVFSVWNVLIVIKNTVLIISINRIISFKRLILMQGASWPFCVSVWKLS